MNAAVPSKAERVEVFKRSTWPERVAMHDAIAARKAEAMAVRRELGRDYLERHPVGCVVPNAKAVTHLDMAAETADARAEAVRLAEGRTSQHNNGSLEFPVLAENFAPDSHSIQLGMSPLILAPVVRYFGMMPVLFNMFVTRAHTTEFLANSPHMFHLDPEDVVSFKVFVHLTDVDDDCGPFHALPADLTQKVLEAVDYRGVGRLTDEQVDGLVGLKSVVKVVGPPGTVAMADTTRCLHFGGRPRLAGKPVRDMLVFQYLLPTSLLFPVDDDARHPQFLPQLSPSDDDSWNALIGARWT